MLKDFFYSVKKPAMWTIFLTTLLSALLFYKENFLSSILVGVKLSLLVLVPGIFVFKIIIPESKDLSAGFVGSSSGIILAGLGYYIFGIFGIKFYLSVFLTPIIIISAVVMYKLLKKNHIKEAVAEKHNSDT